MNDPEKHPRQPNHSEHLAKIANAVNPRVQNEPTPHEPHPMGKRRPDQGRAHHAGEANQSGRGPHH